VPLVAAAGVVGGMTGRTRGLRAEADWSADLVVENTGSLTKGFAANRASAAWFAPIRSRSSLRAWGSCCSRLSTTHSKMIHSRIEDGLRRQQLPRRERASRQCQKRAAVIIYIRVFIRYEEIDVRSVVFY
jgi:hypothetical protein